MRVLIILSLVLFFSCNNSTDTVKEDNYNKSLSYDSTPVEVVKAVWDTAVPVLNPRSNEVFKEVVVERIGQDSFEISGQASVFEANVRWELEDGHYALGDGFTTASTAAPNWGKFNFKVSAPKAGENTTVHIILFEEDMKTGKQKHHLPIYLY